MAVDVFNLEGILTLDSSKFESGLASAGSAASRLGSGIVTGFKKVAQVTAVAIGAASTAVTAFAKSAVSTGLSFDAAMGQVAATAGKTAEELEGVTGSVDTAFGHFEGTMRDFAKFMGKNTAFTATEAAQALNYMALAGYNTQQSMEMLPTVLSMAAAGSMDLARASDMITDTQSALGLSFERTALMVDEFAKAASTGNTSVEQLGEAFLTVGGLGKELNNGFVYLSDGTVAEIDNIEQLEIAFTAMANAGIKGSEAGTHMRNMLLKLANPTKDGAEAFEKMGIEIFDAEGKMKSLDVIFAQMAESFSKMSQQEKLTAIGDIFNARDTASAEALLAAIDSDWDRIGESILDAKGAAEQMAETKLDNLQGQLTKMKSALEGAKIALSDKLTPGLMELAQFGTEAIGKMTTAFEERGFQGLMEEFGVVLGTGLDKLLTNLPKLIEAGKGLLSALGQAILDNMDTITDALAQGLSIVLETAVDAIPGILEFGANLVAKIGQAIAENLPKILDSLGNAADTILEWLSSIFKSEGGNGILSSLLDFFGSLLTKFLTWLGENAGAIVEKLIDIAKQVAEQLPSIVGSIIEALPKIISEIADAIAEGAPDLINSIAKVLETIIVKLTDPAIISSLLDSVLKVVEALLRGVIDALPGLIKAIIQGANNLLSVIPSILEDVLPELIDMILTALEDLLPTLIDGLIDLTLSIVKSLPKIITGLIKAIPKIITRVVKALIRCVPQLVKGLVQLVAGIVKEIPTIIKELVLAVPDMVREIFGSIGEIMDELFSEIFGDTGGLFGGMFETVSEVFMNIWNVVKKVFKWIKNRVEKVFKGIAEVAGPIIETLKGFFQGLWDKVKTVFRWIRNRAKSVFEKIQEIAGPVIEAIKGFFQGLWTKVKTVFKNIKNRASKIFNKIKEIISPIIDDIKQFFSDIWDKAKEVIGDIGDFFAEVFTNMKPIAEAVGDAIVTAFTWVKDKVKSLLETVWGWLTDLIDKLDVLDLLEDDDKKIAANLSFASEGFNMASDIIDKKEQDVKISGEVTVNGVDPNGNNVDTYKFIMNQVTQKWRTKG